MPDLAWAVESHPTADTGILCFRHDLNIAARRKLNAQHSPRYGLVVDDQRPEHPFDYGIIQQIGGPSKQILMSGSILTTCGRIENNQGPLSDRRFPAPISGPPVLFLLPFAAFSGHLRF